MTGSLMGRLSMWSSLSLILVRALAVNAAEPPASPATPVKPPAFQMPVLPYGQNQLEPYVSARTMGIHYGKHQQTYVDVLNKMVADKQVMEEPLEKIIMENAGKADRVAVFNAAAQVWNHTFFWNSMKPGGGGKPTGRILGMIEKSFGSYDQFRTTFIDTALSQFGSGWVWLVQDGETLKVIKTSNADTPVAHGQTALMTCDVWEHAYYLDYQNRRKDYVTAFVDHLLNWDFAASQLK
jgi:superoxide dismutase, Fe-Mn family